MDARISGRSRGGPRDARSCDHRFPILVHFLGDGRRCARCLACKTIGPERSKPEAAREALLFIGAYPHDGVRRRRA